MAIRHDTATPAVSRPQAAELETKLHTLDELLKSRALVLGDSTLLGCPAAGVDDFEEHGARAVDKYVDAAVVKLREMGLSPVDACVENPPVIGMLAPSGIHIIIQIIALNRLGYTSFLISTRLPSPAIKQLLELANCNTILTTSSFHPVLAEVQQQRPLEVLPLLMHSDYYGKDAPAFVRPYNPIKEADKVAVILHSSGSTGLPKPIFLTNKSCIAAASTNLDMRALLMSPMFHSHGFYEIFRSIYSAKPLYFCNYNLPVTRESLMRLLDAVKPDLFHCVPYIVKLLAEAEEGIRAMARMKLLLFAGSGCPDDLGDQLVAKGVNLAGNYGTTEIGRVMNSSRPEGDKAWNYLRPLPQVEEHFIMDEVAPGLYECVALAGLPSRSTTNSDDPPGSFRTRDLFTPHPTRPKLWRFSCRLDDRFTLINGEKVLPIPIEGRIRVEEIVKEAAVFGDGRTYAGLLIVKADRAAHLSDDEFIEKIWPAVEDANRRAEAFSRIPKELIVPLAADTIYPKTDKGTFIRVPMYRQFAQEIEMAYAAFEGQNNAGGTIHLEGEELEQYLLRQLKEQCDIELPSSEMDFFAAGVDSLQCIKMWSLIKRELDLGGRQVQLGQNVLYETGNIKLLARHLEGLKTGKQDEAQNELQTMEGLITKYGTFQPHVAGNAVQPEKESVLLSGVTGALGAHILSQLTAKSSIGTVWAMVRASDDAAASERLYSSLEARGMVFTAEQKAKIVPLSCNLGKPDLGLDASRINELRTGLRVVIHSAWAVNFNLPVQSFEDQHIKAVHNLIQLTLSVQTPKAARFFFCSSVSSAAGTPRPGTVIEAYVPSPAHAQNTGYARSKYVAEHITRNAMKEYGAAARVLRIGQLAGDTETGAWNTTEGIPLMIQTAVTVGALPALNEEMSWLPVDLAASTILDLSNINKENPSDRNTDADLAYHVLNPTRFHWTQQMLVSLASAGLKFDTLPTSEWLEKLRQSDRDPVKNPPIKLLGWFEGKYGAKAASSPVTGVLEYITERSKEDSVTLRSVPDVTDVSYVKKVVERLQKSWGA
ncbi:hypothetical protein B0J13DRAFT_478253 [Dactylonectria estremocensis]|uniref:Carrier domain-containing protein n=1 Tax=Dactylonectria estremocensis TaxID=1079267 RepID=A0A9P9EMP8_9HYPO|nr:hypothetical protein B0J13DRAFT_478253 [Dactylonectria estremocensis]